MLIKKEKIEDLEFMDLEPEEKRVEWHLEIFLLNLIFIKAQLYS
ncbi:MAG TPA: hypothetical protein PLV17_06460 [Spirochaetota bacterium]|jgi:hypothetical protein|nr:hypothetical protein [Spirochaetota bacterium]